MRLQEEEAKGTHGLEEVHYIAIQSRTSSGDIIKFEADSIDGVTDQWGAFSFLKNYPRNVQFFAQISTFNGSDTAGLRYDNLTLNGVKVKVEEEQSADDETTHAGEQIRYFAIQR